MKTDYNYHVTFRTESDSLQCMVSKCFSFQTLGEAYCFAKQVGGRIDGPKGEITWEQAASDENQWEAHIA